jgi:4-amino-4-deoxy-L-arabinose transferase-like glycosyltransferase
VPSRSEPAVVIGLTALGAAVRLFGLGDRSLWVDEIADANAARRGSLGQVLLALPIDQMPLHFVFMYLASGLGRGEVAVRSASVVAGILAVPAIYLAARRLVGVEAAPWAALIAALSAFLVWYAQDATNYSLLVLTSSLAAWAVHRATASPRVGDWALAALALAGTAYSHYSGPLVVVALLGWAGVEVFRSRDRLRLMGLLTAGMLIIAALAPWVPWIRAYLAFAVPLATKTSAGSLPLAWQPVRLAFGLGLLPLVLVLAIAGVAALRHRRPDLGLLVAWALLPAAVLLTTGGVHALELPLRYFTASLPPVLVLAGAGTAYLVRRLADPRIRIPVPTLAGLLIVLCALPQLLTWGGQPKDDWRGAAAAIHAAGSQPAAIALGFGSLWAAPDLDYYLRQQDPPAMVVDGETGALPAAAESLRSAGPVFAIFNSDTGPPVIRTDGRAATGPFDRLQGVPAGLTVTRLTGVTLVRADSADAVLRWAATLEPAAAAWRAMIDGAPAGSAIAIDDGQRAAVTPGDILEARYSCSGARAGIVLTDAQGHSIAGYPTPSGAPCGGDLRFAFTVPAGAVAATFVGSFSRRELLRVDVVA